MKKSRKPQDRKRLLVSVQKVRDLQAVPKEQLELVAGGAQRCFGSNMTTVDG